MYKERSFEPEVLSSKDVNSRFVKHMDYLCAFIIPLCVLLIAMWLQGIWPMGDKSMLLWDMEIQYIDIYNWFYDVLHGNASLFYDFSKSLGGNMYGIYALYLASPINFLVYFFPPERIVYFITISTLLKICLSGLFFRIFITNRFPLIARWMGLLLSVSYALMEYNVGLCSNLHFLDAIYTLPLVALGVYQYISGRKHLLFSLSVGYVVFCNWYIGYMVCFFIILYYLFEAFVVGNKPKGVKGFVYFLKQSIGLGLTAFSGILISCVTFLPSIIASLNGKGEISFDYLKWEFHCDYLEPLKALFPTSQANTSYEEPAIYVGGFAIILILFALFNRKIALKKKFASIVFLGSAFLSFSCVILEVIWTGMKKTASFHFRYSFAFSFLLVFLAAYLYQEGIGIKEKLYKYQIIAAVCFLVISILVSYFHWTESISEYLPYFVFLGLYLSLLAIYFVSRDRRVRFFSAGLMSILLFLELGENTVLAFSRYNISILDYIQYVETMGSQIDDILETDSSFYRLEKTVSEMDTRWGESAPVASEGLTFNYNSITHYSTLYDSEVNDFLAYTGYCMFNVMAVNYADENLVMDSILGLKYLLSDDEVDVLSEIGEFSCTTCDNVAIYENPYALSFATKVKSAVISDEWDSDPFVNQDRILTSMAGYSTTVFADVDITEITSGYFELTVLEDGPVYLYFGGSHPECDVEINGVFHQDYFSRFYQNVMYAGYFSVGDKVTVRLVDDDACEYTHSLYARTIRMDEFSDVMTLLQEKSISPEENTDSYVSLFWSADERETVLLSVPYDEGWNIYIDGVKTEYSEAYNALISIEVEAGEHIIEMRYTPPYFILGIVCTGCGVLMLLFIILISKRLKGEMQNDTI